MQICVIVKESVHRDRTTNELLGSVITLHGASTDFEKLRREVQASIPAEYKVQAIGFHGYHYLEPGFPEGHLVEVNLAFKFTDLN